LLEAQGVPDVPSLLVVDDEAIIRMGLVSLLDDAGHQVLEATGADEAIAILDSRSDIRVVVTDVNMRGSMDGIKLAHYIRERWPPIALIVVSGVPEHAQAPLPEGALFIAKPYRQEALLSSIAGLLARVTP